jgi:protein-S-isoprenylcysteine O-methyltransferase Ste14
VPIVALVLLVAFAALGFGWCSWEQRRRTGSTGFRGVSARLGSAAWFAGVGFVVAMAAAFVAPILQLLGVLSPLSVLHTPWIQITGVFGWVRYPIFTAMMMFGFGIAMVTPNLVAIVGFVLPIAAIERQVRVVEEPYLLTKHGVAYGDYLFNVGRFVPGVRVSR